ncbi:unnamed protein product [Ilex paraguariensis]|uniref:Indole-3-acetic acid-amido synthetase GH3.6 n=1 Tax=Ilex paraguariensis TaxID=185542 RepID=A0ABC8S1A3_9AQUA
MMTDDEIINNIEDTTMDAGRHQLEALQTILEHNAGVAYLRPYLQGYPAPIDAATFRRSVPLSSYEDYADHIHQMADDDDDQPLLSVDPLFRDKFGEPEIDSLFRFNAIKSCLLFSSPGSGTSSANPKLIPYFDSTPSKAVSYLAHQGSAAMLRRLFPPRPSVHKNLLFFYAGNVTNTKGGYQAMAASAFSMHNKNSNPFRLLSIVVSPKEVILGSDVQQQMYCHLLCGLRHSNIVDGIQAPYASGLIRAFSLLEIKWEQLCEDLENGFPSVEIIDVAMRDSVIEVLSGSQPELLKRIRSICEKRDWGGILGKLWPNVRYVKCVSTGSMEQYYPKLKYYAGEIPLLGGDYYASECCVGINLDIMQPPELTRFVMLPSAAYFEFLPYDLTNNCLIDEETVDLSGVAVGKMYEMVVTTYRGLYRYRLGDIVKVTGFYNSSPQLEFVMRAPKTSREILTERDLVSAMASFQLVLKDVIAAEITEFASFLDLELDPKQLMIFIEVKEGCMLLQKDNLQESLIILKRCCSSLEDRLGGIYKVMKAGGEIGPLLVSIVKPGSFDRLLQEAIKNGAPASQYKPPKIIRNHKIADFMEAFAVVTVCLNSLDG